MSCRTALFALALVGGPGAVMVLCFILTGPDAPVRAASLAHSQHAPLQNGLAVTRYVAITGTDVLTCATPASACRTVQYAVDAAEDGDVIKVATGIYTGVQARPAPFGYSGPSVVTQVVYISKATAIRGATPQPMVSPIHPTLRQTAPHLMQRDSGVCCSSQEQ